MTATLTKDPFVMGRGYEPTGTIAFTSSYPVGGETLDLSTLSLPVSKPPYWMEVEIAGPYFATWVPGPTLSTQKLRIFDLLNGSELAPAAYPGPLLAAPVRWRALFHRLQ